MGYLHIDNLYKNQDILLFRECYALEKIHGTSAHVAFEEGLLRFFPGGEQLTRFMEVFDLPALRDRFVALGLPQVIVYGEAYGGKCQGMSATYGKDLKFIVFDVRAGESWLDVPDAAQVATALGLEFVWYTRTPTDLEALNVIRDAPSYQAHRNGMGEKPKEGIVLRPLIELLKKNGDRVIAKHKRDDFRETASTRKVSEEKLAVLGGAKAVAREWVTEMRLTHVLDKLTPEVPGGVGIEYTGIVIQAMLEDVEREGTGEIAWSREVKRAVGSRTAALFKQRLNAGGGA